VRDVGLAGQFCPLVGHDEGQHHGYCRVTELGREAAAERGPATSDTLTTRRYIATWTEIMQANTRRRPSDGRRPGDPQMPGASPA
jgi:hypothetical protein